MPCAGSNTHLVDGMTQIQEQVEMKIHLQTYVVYVCRNIFRNDDEKYERCKRSIS